MTDIVRALIFVIRNTIAIAVLSKQEAAPSDTAINRKIRVHANAISTNGVLVSVFIQIKVIHAGFINPVHISEASVTVTISQDFDIIQILVAAQVERCTHVDINAHRQVEHQGSCQLHHVKLVSLFTTNLQSAKFIQLTRHKVIRLDIPIEFSKQRHEIHKVDFSGGTHERE